MMMVFLLVIPRLFKSWKKLIMIIRYRYANQTLKKWGEKRIFPEPCSSGSISA